ncbi:AAA family ATPase [Spirosoma sp. HMF3257]|uniref:ATP-binding protein n=1 Tax=Spirosoma telluris TaxID=2183553 RepID=A0A327NGI3_9BACT|nr:AAA family ATPase [Spirosoma telluris]RAI74480.1 ATP-binding protein [Spirosoma telluris]
MLIEFSVGNYLSIKDRQTLRLDASSISEYREQLIDAGRYQLLRSAVIYGANASGKSNVLKAMSTMRKILIRSSLRSSTTAIEVEPFLLNTDTELSPSYFEVLFLVDNIRYRYGFEVDRKIVRTEWLFEAKKNLEKLLFIRENDAIDVSKEFKEGKGLEEKTLDNNLFLAVCDQFNGSVAKKIIFWFTNFNTISGLSHSELRGITFEMLDKGEHRNKLLAFYNALALGFTNVLIETKPFSTDILPSELSDEDKERIAKELIGKTMAKAITLHTKYDVEGNVVKEVEFDLTNRESSGTNKLFDLSGPIFDTLQDGGVLVVDELDAKLHPIMTKAIIRLFNLPELNPNNAQLIFATHDTNLLSGKLFRRDQVYFTEKDQYGATCLYSLVEYKEEDGTKVRKDRSFEEDYIQGRYGAIPFIGDLSKIILAWQEKQK